MSNPGAIGSCPACRAPVRAQQGLCVVCGRPLDRAYRRAPSWRLTVLVATSLLILVGVAAGFGAGAAVHTRQVRPQDVTTSGQTTPATPTTPAPAPAPTATAPAAPAPVSPTPAPVTPRSAPRPAAPAR